MDNVLSGAGQPVIINHDRGGRGGDHCLAELISNNGCHDAMRHSEQAMRSLGLHTAETVQCFGLKTLDELCDARREIAEVKCHVSEDGAKTRDLLRDQENNRLRDEVALLRLQLATIGIVPPAAAR